MYMLTIGRNHLEWGSSGQPPVTPALAAVLELIAREIGCDRRAQVLTALARATARLTGPRRPWDVIWREQRSLTVS